jgi:hypothetical protein
MKNLRTKLSYTLYFVSVVFLFHSCKDVEQRRRANAVQDLQIVEFDECEYLVGFRLLTHKGNCKYCAERSKKEEQLTIIDTQLIKKQIK